MWNNESYKIRVEIIHRWRSQPDIWSCKFFHLVKPNCRAGFATVIHMTKKALARFLQEDVPTFDEEFSKLSGLNLYMCMISTPVKAHLRLAISTSNELPQSHNYYTFDYFTSTYSLHRNYAYGSRSYLCA